MESINKSDHGERLATLEANYNHIVEKLDDMQTDVRSIKESAKILASIGEMIKDYNDLKQAVGINLWIVKNKKFVMSMTLAVMIFVISQTGIDIELLKSFFLGK